MTDETGWEDVPDHDHDDADEAGGEGEEGGEEESQVPEGAAIFPFIPPELGIDPLLLGVIHAAVFFGGSEEDIVHPAAAEESLQYIAGYLQRLEGPALDRVQEDVATLLGYARDEKWPKQWVRSLREFLTELGVQKRGDT